MTRRLASVDIGTNSVRLLVADVDGAGADARVATLDRRMDWLNKQLDADRKALGMAYGFGIFLRRGELIGEVSLGSVQRGPFQSAFVGYWVDQHHAGNGYVPEAVLLTLRYAFDDLELHRVEAAIVPRNARSRRVADKLGLRDEGISERFLQIRGVWEDHVRYAMTAEEWAVRRDELERTFLGRRKVKAGGRAR